jgi:hypothetical protein
VTQVQAIVHAVIRKRRQSMLIDRVPQPQLGRDATAEEVQHVEVVAALWRSRQPEQLSRLDVFQQSLVAARGRMVEFIDDDHVEVVRRQTSVASCVQALDRGEDMLELLGTDTVDPELSERWPS